MSWVTRPGFLVTHSGLSALIFLANLPGLILRVRLSPMGVTQADCFRGCLSGGAPRFSHSGLGVYCHSRGRPLLPS